MRLDKLSGQQRFAPRCGQRLGLLCTDCFLAAAQYFWFRHVFLLAPADSDRVRTLALALLADRKLEVQELAATTLSGLLKARAAVTPVTAACTHTLSVHCHRKHRQLNSSMPE